MSRIKKHAVTVILIAAVVAIALMIWSRKATAAVEGSSTPAAAACQSTA